MLTKQTQQSSDFAIATESQSAESLMSTLNANDVKLMRHILMPNKQLGERLHLSRGGLTSRINAVKKKLGVKSRSEIVEFILSSQQQFNLMLALCGLQNCSDENLRRTDETIRHLGHATYSGGSNSCIHN